ncbi:MAG TPA: hypothetical protein VH165_12785 [Kofleriaceae bacterium]|nr:hypothetical protein [Kofleriaceae bacterium]
MRPAVRTLFAHTRRTAGGAHAALAAPHAALPRCSSLASDDL